MQESTLEIQEERRFIVCEAVWDAGGSVRWNANRPNFITITATVDNFNACRDAVNANAFDFNACRDAVNDNAFDTPPAAPEVAAEPATGEPT